MKKLSKYLLFLIVFCSSFNNSYVFSETTAACNWQARNPYINFWDSCTNSKSVNGYIGFNSNISCFKFNWKVNGVNVGTGRSIYYPVTQNGTYVICVTVTDTCNNCDTTFCSTRTISCINRCNWGTNLYTNVWDSCTATNHALYGYSTNNSCYKYLWKVNNVVVGTSRYLTYPVTQNGTYNVCLVISDTCTRCDTTICSTRTINCISRCNWGTNLYTNIWDSCTATNRSLYGYSTNNSCYKYLWKVNNVVVGTNRYLTHPVTQNGTYNVCLVISDTCTRCDTTVCSTRTISCINRCNWGTNLYTNIWDSCTATNRSLYGYAIYNACYKYQWKVNGVAVSTNRYLTYPVTQNGTYNVCLVISDTCTRCDTTICSTRTINCISRCNWGTNLYTNIWDSCTATNHTLYGYSTNNSCYKYLWKVNNVVVGTNRYLTYPVTQNGTYNVCLVISDTCTRCDTTICSTRTISCIPASCNWQARNPYINFWDSCTNSKSVNGYIGFNSNISCFKFNWKVNGVNVGTGRSIYYPVTQNSTYVICVTVTDTCNHCDTTFCSTRIINCIGTTTGIQYRKDLSQELNLYPNPTNGWMTLTWTQENSQYVLATISGQVLEQGELNKGTQTADFSRYPNGIYFLQVQTPATSFTRKILIEK